MNNNDTTYGGELIEFCVIEHYEHIIAIGIRYLPGFGMHYIITSPIVTHVRELDTITTLDKHYKLNRLITFDDAFALYHTYFRKTLTREFWSTEQVLTAERNIIN
jgi:hypothetical protein